MLFVPLTFFFSISTHSGHAALASDFSHTTRAYPNFLRGGIHVGFLSVDVPNAVDREGHKGFLIPTAPAKGQHQAHGEAANGAFANFLFWQLSELSRRPFSGLHRESKPTTRQPYAYCGPGWD